MTTQVSGSVGADADAYLLGVDVGQTAVKAVVHDARLQPVAVGRRSSPVDRRVPRHAERAQDDLWASAADAIVDAVAAATEAGVAPERIAAVGITGHGDGLHLVTAAGEPVGPAITAMDSRAYREAEQLAADSSRLEAVLRLSGQRPTAGAAGNLLRYLETNEPALLRRADVMVFCKDIIRLRLTGTIATDYSDATASFLDTATATWSTEVLDAYGLGADYMRMLPPLLRSGDIAGTVTPAAAARTGLAVGTPVIAGMHDVQAASIGMGALVPGRLALVAGSFSTNGVTTVEDHVDPRWQSRLSITPDLRIAMSTSATAAPAMDWALELLGATEQSDRDALFAAAVALPAQEAVPLFLPFLFDSPLRHDATAALAGLHGSHTRAHVARGVLEGIVLMHVWHTRVLGERFAWERPVRLGGGLANAPLYVQLVANALREPIVVAASDEPGAFGAAAVAGVSVGLLGSVEEAQELVPLGAPVEPTAESAAYWENKILSFDELATAQQPWWLAQAGRL